MPQDYCIKVTLTVVILVTISPRLKSSLFVSHQYLVPLNRYISAKTVTERSNLRSAAAADGKHLDSDDGGPPNPHRGFQAAPLDAGEQLIWGNVSLKLGCTDQRWLMNLHAGLARPT